LGLARWEIGAKGENLKNGSFPGIRQVGLFMELFYGRVSPNEVFFQFYADDFLGKWLVRIGNERRLKTFTKNTD